MHNIVPTYKSFRLKTLIFGYINVVLSVVFSMMHTVALHSQEMEKKLFYLDQVLLTDGSRYVGEVLEITNEIVSLQLRAGSILPINRSIVKRIYQHVPQVGIYHDQEPTFMDYNNRYFFGLDKGLSFGISDSNIWGFELAGYIKRKLNTRHLIGIRNTLKIQSDRQNYGFYLNDINLEYNYLLYKLSNVTPYVSCRFGTGFVLNEKRFNTQNTSFYPGGGIGIGLIKGIGKRSVYFFEFSYDYQTYGFRYDHFWQGEIIRRQVYENLCLRVGYWF